MKQRFSYLAAAVLGGFLATGAMAETVSQQTTTTTTNSSGTVSEFGPTSFTIKDETSPAPIAYTYSKTTTYVDEDGNAVAMETVRSGAPVTVYYTKTADGMEASKVVVRKTTTTTPSGAVLEKKTTTTTTPAP